MGVPGESGTVVEEGRRRQKYVLTGLLLTLVGFVLLGIGLPTAPAALVQAIPVAAAGLLALWIGGILLGNVLSPMWKRRPGRRRVGPANGGTMSGPPGSVR